MSARGEKRIRERTVHRHAIYFFGWPGTVGGANTKMAHLLRLLSGHQTVCVVPPAQEYRSDRATARRIRALGHEVRAMEDLPSKLSGWGLVMCYPDFCIAHGWEMKQRGLKLAWSNEMMWHVPGELTSMAGEMFDVVLYTGPTQRAALEPLYIAALTGVYGGKVQDLAAEHGTLPGGLRWVMTGNYVDPAAFPFRDRARAAKDAPLVVGRLSRADPDKFPDNFPEFYEGLGLNRPRFRVMAWSEKLRACWPRHRFSRRWELLPVFAEDASRFLRSLDLFVYSLGPKFRESWGRAVVEAMLSGAVPLIPSGEQHHLESLMPNGTGGFHCATDEEFGARARELEADPTMRWRMARQAREWAVEVLCRREEHLARWEQVFHG